MMGAGIPFSMLFGAWGQGCSNFLEFAVGLQALGLGVPGFGVPGLRVAGFRVWGFQALGVWGKR